MSISLDLEENSLFEKSNNRKTLLRQLFVSTIKLLIFGHCLEVMFSKEKWWMQELLVYLLWRCRWIGIKLVMTSIYKVGNVWKALKIYEAALCCIFLSSLRENESNTLL